MFAITRRIGRDVFIKLVLRKMVSWQGFRVLAAALNHVRILCLAAALNAHSLLHDSTWTNLLKLCIHPNGNAAFALPVCLIKYRGNVIYQPANPQNEASRTSWCQKSPKQARDTCLQSNEIGTVKHECLHESITACSALIVQSQST